MAMQAPTRFTIEVHPPEPGNGLDSASLDLLAKAVRAHRISGGTILAASHQPIGLDDARELRL